MSTRRLLILGGARSGKSREAERLAAASGRAVLVIATGEAGDDEMAARIAQHRADRPDGWRTVEEPLRLAEALSEADQRSVVIVDCLTLWLANLMHRSEDIEAASAALTLALDQRSGPTLLVSNETGLGIVPATPLGRAFRDAQGQLNQRMAACCDTVLLMVAGLPLRLKPAPELAGITLA